MNPDELLAQITALCSDFVSGGGDPAMLAEALTPVLQGGGGDPGMPPDAGADMGAPPPPMPGDEGGMPDISGMMPSAPPTSNGGAHPFADASAMAIEDIKKRKQGL